MIVSEIRYKLFKESMRLDSEYYLPKYIEVEESLKSLSVRTIHLKELANFIKKGIFYILAEEYRKEGIPFIRVSNIKPLLLDYKDLVFISDKKNIEEQKMRLYYF